MTFVNSNSLQVSNVISLDYSFLSIKFYQDAGCFNLWRVNVRRSYFFFPVKIRLASIFLYLICFLICFDLFFLFLICFSFELTFFSAEYHQFKETPQKHGVFSNAAQSVLRKLMVFGTWRGGGSLCPSKDENVKLFGQGSPFFFWAIRFKGMNWAWADTFPEWNPCPWVKRETLVDIAFCFRDRSFKFGYGT